MILRRGDIDNLVGSGIIYWDISEDNPIVPGCSIFAINFAVSPLTVDGKLLTATFPPVPMSSVEELFARIRGVQCDVVYAGEMEFPQDVGDDLTSFYNKEIEAYNNVIEEYAEMYRGRFELLEETLSEKERLRLLERLSKEMREEMRKEAVSDDVEEIGDGIIVQDGLLEEIIGDDVVEQGIENRLEGYDLDYEERRKSLSRKKIVSVITKLNEENKYDIDNFLSVLFMPGIIGDKLVNLYTKKFFAIYNENYEEASSIKEKILTLEQNL